MRYYGYFDIDLYCGVEDQDYEPMDFNEVYRERQWDFCEAGKSILAEYAGMSRRSIPEQQFSVKSVREDFWGNFFFFWYSSCENRSILRQREG